ncbi:MAG: hypothetical protein K1Y02_14515 [Candidatus Hydrogenedentes bacterium]|nr:hypothetical protein [Candidatus Hydrogenedentota bacterium]
MDGLALEIGEVMLERGIQFELDGQEQNAANVYRDALDLKFSHSVNRTETLTRLGKIVLWQGEPEKALSYLEEAFNRGNFNIWLYFPLCEALLQMRRYEDGLERCRLWYNSAEAQNDRYQQAQAKLMEGRLFRQKGDADRALQAFRDSDQIQPGGLSAYYAGDVLFEKGEFEMAIRYIESYLPNGEGENLAWANEILRSAKEQLSLR